MKKKLITILSALLMGMPLLAQNSHGNPFSHLGYEVKIATLTDFEEFHDFEEVVEIGQVFYDTKKREIVGFVGEKDYRIELIKDVISTSIDPLCEKYPWISPYAYCMNNPVNLIDPDGRDWYRFQDGDGNWQYQWSEDIHSQKALNKVMENAEYLGKTYINENTYYSLFGSTADASSKEGKAIAKLDDAFIKYADYIKESRLDSDAFQKSTDFDIGVYLRTSAIGLSEGGVFDFQYGEGTGYYYVIGEGQPNYGKFGSWGKDEFRSNSNRNTGSMKSGYNITFERNGGSSNNYSARIVFPTIDAKNNLYNTFRKLFF